MKFFAQCARRAGERFVRRLCERCFVDQPNLLQSLLGILELVKLRPAMYFGHEEPAAAITFLAGFSSAAGTALGWDWERRLDILKNVTKSRGWRWTATGPQHQMAAKGWP